MAHPTNVTEYDIAMLTGMRIKSEPAVTIHPEPTTEWCERNAARHRLKDATIRRLNSELLIACIIAATGWIAAVGMWWRS